MNIAILGSGGDGAGMNMCLYELCKRLKKHNVMLFYRGYQGIIDNAIIDFDLETLNAQKGKGGIIIKSSRSPEFMTDKGFKKALSILQKNKVDVLIVMGGNGSLKGAKELKEAGVNILFIPTTIDNDIEESDYSIGFDTAVANAVDFINKVDTSMQAFDRVCIYEVMGRHCPDIANEVTLKTGAEYCYTGESSKRHMLQVVKVALREGKCPKVILQENVLPADELKEYLNKYIKNLDVKVAVVGYVQRGGDATQKELKMASGFAKAVCDCVVKGTFNKIICFSQQDNVFVAKDI